MKKMILFDLDGTLTESGEGITKSVRYALEKMGRPEPDLQKLRVFVGPPLTEQFMAYAGMSREEAEQAVIYYRERYSVTGIFENRESVDRVLEHFALKEYFDGAVGSELDGRRSKKADVIEEVLRRFDRSDHRERVIMVGDKEHDVIGAREAGIPCVGVTYGYGTMEELEHVKPSKIVHTVKELLEYLLEL